MENEIRNSMKEAIELEVETAKRVSKTIDYDALEDVVNLIADTNGRIIVTACGASGAAGKKISHMFNFIDRSSMFLDHGSAPHGDYGMIRKGDVLIIITKSGKTREMDESFEKGRQRGAIIIGVTENPESKIAKESDYTILLDTGDEVDPWQCVASASIIGLFMAFDAISVGIMKKNGIDENFFRGVHPGGGVGVMLNE